MLLKLYSHSKILVAALNGPVMGAFHIVHFLRFVFILLVTIGIAAGKFPVNDAHCVLK